jgi:hypothetical protein
VWPEARLAVYHHLVEQVLLRRTLMLVKISCARCQGALMLNEDHVGRLVRCPTCKSTFTAQPPESAEVEVVEPELELIESEPAPASAENPVAIQLELEPPAPRRRPVEPPLRPEPSPRSPVVRRRPGRRFHFPVRVLDDSSGELEGSIDAVASNDGLELRQGRRTLLFAPVGTPATYAGNNEVEVIIDQRRVRLAVTKRVRGQRLAQDLVDFLNEERDSLNPDHYRVPRVLLVAGIGLPVAALLVVGVVLLIRLITTVPRIDESAWKEFRPPEAQCRLLMPGTPGTRQQPIPNLNQLQTIYTVQVERPRSEFMFTHLRVPRQAVGQLNLNDFVNGVRQETAKRYPGTKVLSQREIRLEGHPGREFILEAPGQGKAIFRVFLLDDNVYMLGVEGKRFEPDTPDVVKFFDSFKLLDKQPAQPPGPNPPPWQQPQPPEKPQSSPPKEQALPLVATLKASANRGPPSVTFFPASDRLLVGRDIYVANGWIKQGALGGNPIPSVVALAPNGQTAAVAGAPGELDLVDVASARRTKLVQHNVREQPEAIAALAFSPDGKTLAGHTDSNLILWDVATGTKRATHSNDLRRATTGVPVVAFSPDNAHLATSSGVERVILRDPKSGDVDQDLWTPPHAGVTALAFSRDGKRLAWMDSSGEGTIWDLVVLRTFPFLSPSGPRASRVHTVAFASDGRTVAATGSDDRVIFVDIKGVKQRSMMRTGHAGSVRNLAFSPDGQFLATTGNDGAVKVWDASSLIGGVGVRPPPPPQRDQQLLATLSLP